MTVPEFKKHQYEFTAHIRDPKKNAKPDGIEDRRMGIYRELLYNNIEGFIASGFPVIHTIYSDKNWQDMVRDFFARHKSHSPYFLEISQEFINYLQNERQPHDEDPAGLVELAHYEWVELALSISELTDDLSKLSAHTNLLDEVPVLSNLAWLLSYQFPVHQISTDFLPEQAGNQTTHIVASRGIDEEHINFTEVNPVIARLLELISDNKQQLTGKALLTQIANELGNPDIESIINFGIQTLTELLNKNIIIGTIKI